MLNKNHPNANALNSLISKRFYEIQKAIVTLDDKQGYTFDALKEILSPEPVKTEKLLTCKEYAQTVIDDMIKVKRTGNALVYLTAVNRLLAYCHNPNITFKEIEN